MMLALATDQYRMILSFAVALFFAIPGTILFDQIIRFMYEHRRDIWEAEERPSGLFYRPPGARFWQAFSREYGVNWTLRTPEWMRSEPYCLRNLRMIQYLALAGTVTAIGIWFIPII